LLPSKCGSGLLPRRNEFAFYMALAHATEVLHIRCHTNDVLENQVYSFLRAKTSIINALHFWHRRRMLDAIRLCQESTLAHNRFTAPVAPVLLFAKPEML
jgi:hypothetical protein